MRLGLAAVIVLFAHHGSLAAAQEVEQPARQPIQELFRTEVVYPQERGELQITASPGVMAGGDRRVAIPIAFEYGLTDAWQIELEWESFSRVRPTSERSAAGAGGFEIGTKYSFLAIAGTPLHAAVGVEAEFPRGAVAREDGETEPETGPYVALALDFPALRNFQVFADARVTTELEDGAEASPSWHAGALMPFRRVTIATELAVESFEGERLLELVPSLTLRLPAGWEAGVGVAIGLGRTSDQRGVVFNILREL